MECSSCGHRNRAGARFCGECAAPLGEVVACPSCGAANPVGQRFCNECGEALAAAEPRRGESAPPQGAAPAAPAPPPEHLAEMIRAGGAALAGERKQVTVLFADVMGSMDLAERTDPERWRRIMDRFVSILCGGIHRFEGTVDKFTGDGIMALFGAPIAHEDHAQRACFAALHLIDQLAVYAAELRRSEGLSFSVRIGLNSGEVVVGSVGEDLSLDYTAVGHTVGLAQRMESLAEPGRAYLTTATAKLVEGFVALEDLGEFEVKGVSDPVEVFELRGVGPARSRLDVSRSRGLSRFVGRTEEMKVLEEAVEEAHGGEGLVVGVVGEPGVGKSRLCWELAERCRARGISVYTATGRAHTKHLPLVPVLEMLRSYFGISEEHSDQEARERIAGRLLLLDDAFRDDLPLMLELLGVPDPDAPPSHVNPEARQRRLLSMVKHLVQVSSEREPGIIVLEDLHWIDPGSEQFLAHLVDAIKGTRSLAVVNFRPGYGADWMRRSYYRQISLTPLGAEASEELLAFLLGEDPSLDGAAEVIAERSGGNPFFIEEIVQALVEGGVLDGEAGSYRLVRPIEEASLPATVESLLASRIDALDDDDKAVLQAAAVIGKEFPAPLLAEVAGLGSDKLEAALRQLVASEFVQETALYPEPEYAFKHPLTQEVAYASQLSDRRARMHAAVGEAIERLDPEHLDEHAGLLAQHWEQAGETLLAARWSARAAAWAGFNHPGEAVRHWRRVFELVGELEHDPETVALGTTARLLVLQFGWRLGIAREEADRLYREAKELVSQGGDDRMLASLEGTYGIVLNGSGEFGRYLEHAREAYAIANRVGDDALFMATAPALTYAGWVNLHVDESLEATERMIEVGRGDPTLGAGMSVGSPLAWAFMFRGNLRIQSGQLAEAARDYDRALELARHAGDLETTLWTYSNRGTFSRLLADPEAALAHTRRGLEIAERIGDSFSRIWANSAFGGASLAAGDHEQAIRALQRAQAIASETQIGRESELFRMAQLALAQLGAGDETEAIELATRAWKQLADGAPWQLADVGLARAEVLLATRGAAAADEAARTMDRLAELIAETGWRLYQPHLHRLRAENARLLGDFGRRESELREMLRCAEEIGAARLARRAAQELTGTAA